MSKTKKLVSFGSALAGLLATTPMSVLAVPSDTLNITTNQYVGLNEVRPSNVIAAVINFVLGVAGIISFIYLLWGGVQWIMAGGDKEGTEKARKKITAALIGLAIVFSAYALLYIVRVLFDVDIISVNLQNIRNY